MAEEKKGEGRGRHYIKKKKKGQFEIGHAPYRVQRLSASEYLSQTRSTLSTLESYGTGHFTRQSVTETKQSHSMRILHTEKTGEMFTKAMKMHNNKKKNKCNEGSFYMVDVKKKGLVGQFKVKCRNCAFESDSYKLYEEVDEPNKRGTKKAVTNVAFSTAAVDMPCGQEKLGSLIASIDIPPLNVSQMTRTAQVVGEKIVEECEESMDHARREAQNIKHELDVAADARYNTARIGCSRRSGANLANQSITLVVEKNTGSNKVIAQSTQNKICHKGNRLRAQGIHVECAGDHEGCTANVKFSDSLRETAAGLDVGQQFRSKNIKVESCVTDGDGGFATGLESGLNTPVLRQSDPVHLTQTTIRHGKSSSNSFSEDMFPGVTAKTARNQCQDALAVDIGARCSLVRKNLQKTYKGNLDQMKAAAPGTIETIIECYSGACGQRCKDNPDAGCAGGDSSDNWIGKSHHLQKKNIHCLNCTSSDKKKISDLCNLKLSASAIDKSRNMTTTQNNEAYNRSLSSNCPKILKFSVGIHARRSSAILKINEGAGVASALKLKACNIKLSDGQKKYYYRKHIIHIANKIKHKSQETIKRRWQRDSRNRMQRAALHQRGKQSDYAKDHLDLPANKGDHSYTVSN